MFKTYYSAKYILKKGALFNYVNSDRSDGKTFDCKVRALEDYAQNKHITVYVRRFKTEITIQLYNNFFNDVLGDESPEKATYRELYGSWQFKGSKHGIQVSTDNGKTWDYIVLFVILTMSGKLKSQLDPFVHRIFIIDFDEYIPLDDKYAINEMELLLELWNSIDRDRDKVQLIILGNRVTPFSPFLDYFDVSISILDEGIKTYKNGELAIQIYANNEHRTSRKKSRFNQLVEGTEYEGYRNGGILKVLSLKYDTIDNATIWCSFITSNGEGTIWYKDNKYIISTKKRKDTFCLVDKLYSTNRQEYVITLPRFTALLKMIYKTGNLYYENDKIYHIFEPILRKVWR